MNILFLSTRSPYPLISGHSLRTYHILKSAALKHNVWLVTFIQLEDELRKKHLDHLQTFCKGVFPFRIPVDTSKLKLITSLFINLFSINPFVTQKYNASMFREKIKELISENNIDLVHVDMLPLAVYLNEFGNFKKVLVNHNVESIRLYRWFKTESNFIKKYFLGLQWLKLKAFERAVIEKFDACVVVSEVDQQLLKEIGVTNKLFIVPNGTDTNFFKPSEKKTVDNSIIWIGHMDVHTNKDAVLYFWQDIWPVLQKKHPQSQMVFVGTSPPKEIKEAAQKDDSVTVTGFVDDIRPYLADASVVVVPIRIGSGTRLKILDAMACGKAIVSTTIGCEGLDVSDGENIAIADGPEEFALRTIDLLKNIKMRNEMEKNARKLALTYDWEVIGESQQAVYDGVIRRKK